ncbi:hypothetical protein [Lacticaseibacillus paracasei]|uniref:hypothetical protein n=1 Tax=Lacticaseibacillus paracasei TaxID=1597 RepID=UPI003B514C1C
MTKPSKEIETIDQLLADPWAVNIQGIWEQAAHLLRGEEQTTLCLSTALLNIPIIIFVQDLLYLQQIKK